VTSLKEIDEWQSNEAMAEASTDERVSAAIQVLLSCIATSGKNIEKLDKSLLDFHISELDRKISEQLDAVMHHPEFKKVESLWRGTWSMVSGIDFRKNVKVELLDVSKQHLREDFDDAPEIIQSGLYRHTYIEEYDTPGGEPIASVISSYEFDNSPQDIALLRNISRVAAASHMPFIGAVGPAFFLKNSMEEVAAIKDIGNYFDRAEYIKWKAFRDTDDARYIGLTMPNVLGRLPYGPDTVPVRSFNYVEAVKGPDHDKYLWTSAAFAFATNMAKSFINNGWCVQIRGPQAGGAVTDLPIHLYDLGTGNQVKIPTEVMIRKRASLNLLTWALSRFLTIRIATTPVSSPQTPAKNLRFTTLRMLQPIAVSMPVCLTSSCCRALPTTSRLFSGKTSEPPKIVVCWNWN
jgi:type VI secretion system protein ImpC